MNVGLLDTMGIRFFCYHSILSFKGEGVVLESNESLDKKEG